MTPGADWQIQRRPYGRAAPPVRLEVGEALPLVEGAGWQIFGMRRSSEPELTPGAHITIVPGDPVLRGTAEQVKIWGANELIAIPITISKAPPGG